MVFCDRMPHRLSELLRELRLVFAREHLPPPPVAEPSPSGEPPMSHVRHVFRVALVVAVGLAVALLARGFLVPASYGLYGPYRHDNVAEQMNVRAPVHRGPAACGECHGDELEKRAAGSHK